LLDVAGGRLNASRRALSQAAEAEHLVPIARRRLGFDAVPEWFAATLPLAYSQETLSRARQSAQSFKVLSSTQNTAFQHETELGAPVQLEPARQYTLGVLSLRLHDTASATAASARLRQLAESEGATVLTRDLDRGLRARLAWQMGQPDDALRLLETLESNDSQGDVAATPFVSRASERFLHGEILTSMGRNAEALRWFASLGDGSVTDITLRAPSHLRQAEIHERLGNRTEAARHYKKFLELWSDADPELQTTVNTARRALAVAR
jgi:tetratricopeptide (TPR) repeat protein